MASKKFLNKTCVYCRVPSSSSTRDHVFAESFFEGVVKPSKLPQAPACSICNTTKSNLETYLAAVLLFGSRLKNSKKILSESAIKRLRKNHKLHKELVVGSTTKWKLNPANGLILPAIEHIPFDNEKFTKWLIYIVQGLSFCYFKTILFDNDGIGINMLRAIDNRCLIYDEIFKRCPIVEENLSEVFCFRGVVAENIIVWELKILGGLTFDESNKAPDRIFGVVTKNQLQKS
ncbi:MAG: hypothetical protein V4612_01090 [Pseudomonadota bacterium]